MGHIEDRSPHSLVRGLCCVLWGWEWAAAGDASCTSLSSRCLTHFSSWVLRVIGGPCAMQHSGMSL
jgi:hypothetical protein